MYSDEKSIINGNSSGKKHWGSGSLLNSTVGSPFTSNCLVMENVPQELVIFCIMS